MSFSLEVLLAAMLGGGREGDKLVHYRLLMFMYLLTISWGLSWTMWWVSLFLCKNPWVNVFNPSKSNYKRREQCTIKNNLTKNGRLEMIVTSFQDSKLHEKQVSQSFSYCELINSPRNGTKVRCLSENKKMLKKSVFCEAWSPEMMSFPIPCFLVSQFCNPSEVKFHVFGTPKHGEGKSPSNFFCFISNQYIWEI